MIENLGGTIPASAFTSYNVTLDPIPANNQGLEGISYDPERNVFYGISEGSSNDWGLYKITLGVAPSTTVSNFDNVEDLPLFTYDDISWPSKPSKVSDVYYDPNSKHLFITDHSTSNAPNATYSKVWQCDLEGNLINVRSLVDSFGKHYNQIEGIAFSPDGRKIRP